MNLVSLSDPAALHGEGRSNGGAHALPSWLNQPGPLIATLQSLMLFSAFQYLSELLSKGNFFPVKQTCKVARHIQGKRDSGYSILVLQSLFKKIASYPI